MVSDPDDFRPGGGETTAELCTRAAAAWHDLPPGATTIVIAHGGPIAAVRALVAGQSTAALLGLVPACGEIVTIDR